MSRYVNIGGTAVLLDGGAPQLRTAAGAAA